MKSTRSSEQKRVILGSALGLCILGGAFGWHKWQTRRGEWGMPVYTRIQTAQGLAYQEIPLEEYKKSWKEMASTTPPRYMKLSKEGEYGKLYVPEAMGLSMKAGQFSVQHNFPAAIAALRKAVSIDPNDPQLQWQLGLMLQRGGQTKEAEQVLSKVAQEPDSIGRSAALLLQKIQRNPNYGQPKP